MTLEFISEGGGGSQRLKVAPLEVGDIFVRAKYAQYGYGLQHIATYTVIKAGKRDVVCQTRSGLELRLNVKDVEYNCYAVNDPKVAELQAELKRNNDLTQVVNAMRNLPRESVDDEFLAAGMAFIARLEAKKEKV